MDQNEPAAETLDRASLQALVEKWQRQCLARFESAKHEPTEFGRRFISHGAVNIYNCMCDLERALAGQAGQPGQATGDLPLQVVQQDTKSP